MRKLAIVMALITIAAVGCGTPEYTATAPLQTLTTAAFVVPTQDAVEATLRPTRTAWPTQLPFLTATLKPPPLRLDMELDWIPEEASAEPLDKVGTTWLVANSDAIQSRQVANGALNWEYALPIETGDKRGRVSGIRTSYQSDRVAVGYQNGEIYILSAKDGSLTRSVTEQGMILGLDFSLDGSFLYTMGRPYDGFAQIVFWALDGGQDGTVDEGGSSFRPLGDTGLLVTNQLAVFDTTTRQRVRRLSDDYQSMNAIDVSPSGEWLTANYSDAIFAWHITGVSFEPVNVPSECMPPDPSWNIGIVPVSDQGILFARSYQSDVGPEKAFLCDLPAQQYLGEIANVEQLFIMAENRVVTKTREDPTWRIWSWSQ